MKKARYDLQRWFVKGIFWSFNLYLWSLLGLILGGNQLLVQLNLQSIGYSFLSCMLVGVLGFLLYGIFWSIKHKTRLSLHERAFMRRNPPEEIMPVFNITIALTSLGAFLVVLGSTYISAHACGMELVLPFPQNLVLPWLITALIAGLWSAGYYQLMEWTRLDAEKIKR